MDWDCCVYRYDIECHCYPNCRGCDINPDTNGIEETDEDS